ncbi:MAG: pilus assembly protein TadG-related protein [Hyphomicrobiaceae bacterium]
MRRFAGIKSYFADARGSIAIQAAVAVPLLLLLVGSTIDFAAAIGQRNRLQEAIDKATLSAARELGLSDARRENIAAIVDAMVAANLGISSGSPALPAVTTTISSDPLEISVVAHQLTKPVFGGSFGLSPADVEVQAVARIVGKPNLCVLALDRSEAGAVDLANNASLVGNNCSVFSNSVSQTGISVGNNSAIAAQNVCSAGGVAGNGAITPGPLTDCPQFDDPLSGRSEPAIDACDYNAVTVNGGMVTLSPGVYCGGLTIKGSADVVLSPGVYTIADGSLVLNDTSVLKGASVSILLGPTADLRFQPTTTVSLEATTSGPLAGMLVFASREQAETVTHQILSRNAQKLVGTIYMPTSALVIDGDSKFGTASAYTAIVARKLTLKNGPTIVLNTNYDLTNVPVPPGIRGTGQPPKLVK